MIFSCLWDSSICKIAGIIISGCGISFLSGFIIYGCWAYFSPKTWDSPSIYKIHIFSSKQALSLNHITSFTWASIPLSTTLASSLHYPAGFIDLLACRLIPFPKCGLHYHVGIGFSTISFLPSAFWTSLSTSSFAPL